MRFWQHLAHQLGGGAGVDQVVDNEDLRPVIELGDLGSDGLEDLKPALRLVVVIGGDAHRLDHPDLELSRDDRRRNETAAGDGDDGVEGACRREPPRQGARIPVELVPRNREGLVAGGRRHGATP